MLSLGPRLVRDVERFFAVVSEVRSFPDLLLALGEVAVLARAFGHPLVDADHLKVLRGLDLRPNPLALRAAKGAVYILRACRIDAHDARNGLGVQRVEPRHEERPVVGVHPKPSILLNMGEAL